MSDQLKIRFPCRFRGVMMIFFQGRLPGDLFFCAA